VTTPDRTELHALGRAIIDRSLYMVLGTADASGTPWVTPVYFAPNGYRTFLWVSRPESRHSGNLDARRELSIVIFDSSAPIGTGRGVYVTGFGQKLTDDERQAAVDLFSRRSLSHGGRAWTIADVELSAPLRLYRATATEQYVSDESDRRVPVDLDGE
jgi:nitroimidazol reductase NimA-like FMN-containing flavoprotein (pyridoxamine 5'-phosphate oxidase superfamily)